jgi:hypothetical protein
MTYYAFIENEQINGCGQCRCLNEDVQNIEITEEVYNNLADYIYVNGEVVINPNLDEIRLQEAKDNKYQEALIGAKAFIENGAVYQFDENNSIEATDGNIGKMTAYALAFQTGTVDKVYWTSKEDNVLELSAEDILTILTGLGTIQSEIWNVKFVTYKTAIEQATTVEEVEAIEINYEMEGE